MTSFSINELNSGLYKGQLVDETGVGFNLLGQTNAALVLTLYDKVSKAIINTRQSQNVLNANNVVIDTSGNITWTILPLDNPIFNDGLTKEVHVALFTATWTVGGVPRQMNHEVTINVVNLSMLP